MGDGLGAAGDEAGDEAGNDETAAMPLDAAGDADVPGDVLTGGTVGTAGRGLLRQTTIRSPAS